MRLVEFERLTVAAGARTLIRELDWRIDRLEHAGIIGPNGSGKSLLASTIMGHCPPRQGTIRYHFDREGEASHARSWCYPREISCVTPNDQRSILGNGFHQARWNSFTERGDTVEQFLSPHKTARVNPYQRDAPPLPVREFLHRRERAMELLGITHLRSRHVAHLSDGEWRKVLIARSLIPAPQLLILDDPFCGLDAAARNTLTTGIDALMQSGAYTLLLMTTREEEVPRAIRRRLHLSGGEPIRPAPRAEARESSSRGAIPGNGERLVELEHVSIAYGDVRVLEDVSWTMRRGEHWLITGPNGAGKSTLLSLILADNPQGYGQEIRLFGRARGAGDSIWEFKRRIGWVAPELRVYYTGRTGTFDTVCSGFFDSIGLHAECTAEQQKAAHDCLALLGLAKSAGRSFSSLSIGEQRLTLLARALVKRPELLILDEPCQGLDAQNRRAIHQVLDRLCCEYDTHLIYVTHHQEERPRVLTHHLELECGKVVAAHPIAASGTEP